MTRALCPQTSEPLSLCLQIPTKSAKTKGPQGVSAPGSSPAIDLWAYFTDRWVYSGIPERETWPQAFSFLVRELPAPTLSLPFLLVTHCCRFGIQQ